MIFIIQQKRSLEATSWEYSLCVEKTAFLKGVHIEHTELNSALVFLHLTVIVLSSLNPEGRKRRKLVDFVFAISTSELCMMVAY